MESRGNHRFCVVASIAHRFRRLILVFLLVLEFWCCFWHEDELIRGNPIHFEGWYDNEGKEQMVIWMDRDHKYTVYLEDLTMIYYEDRLAIG